MPAGRLGYGGNNHDITPPDGMPDYTRPESGGQTKAPGDVTPTPSMTGRPRQQARRKGSAAVLGGPNPEGTNPQAD
jgi:hypothetical protein